MPLVLWTKKYSVNIGEIDRQHRTLFSLINDFHDALKKGEGRKLTEDILARMVAYAEEHFSSEEGYMAAHGYPGYGPHRKAHEYFMGRVKEYQRDFGAGRLEVPLDVMRFLMDWLVEHVEGTDMRYAPFLNERGVF
ncbi:MAG: hemerythrin family protein [Thermodesulfovibrionales bacterium]